MSFTTLFVEYEECKSLEAKVVKDADNLDVDLELMEQKSRGIDLASKKGWLENRKYVYSKFYTKTAKSLWKDIYTANPHDWHLKGRNRRLAGDWRT